MSLSREEILACLKGIKAPSGVDIVEAGLVRALNVEDGAVRFVMEVDNPEPFMAVNAEAEEKLAAIGATSVAIVMTAHSKPKPPPDLKLGRKAELAGPEKIPALIGSSRLRLVKAGLGNQLSRPIWPARLLPKGAAWGCWTRMYTARRSRACLACLAVLKAPMAN